ncbi:MAG: hypothetical protein GY838_03900 [bacterium]|nr:hypothetical protein [bacterium]
MPYLYADHVRFACSPEMGSASLVYQYGEKIRPDESAHAVYERLDLVDQYVKIEIDQPDDDAGDAVDPILWYGLVPESLDLPGGVAGDNPAVASGAQSFTAVGLEFLLDRKRITSSLAEGFTGDERLHRAVGFNLGGGNARDTQFQANRSTGPGHTGGAYIFAETLESAVPWRVNDIVGYLLVHHAPADKDGDQTIEWRRNLGTQWLDLEWHTPAMHVHGKTVKQVLDTLIARTRLSGYRVNVNDDDQVILSVFTFNDQDVNTPSGKTINANDDTITWNFDTNPLVRGAVTIKQSAAHVHHTVVARGERRTATVTLDPTTATNEGALIADWTDDARTAYLAGATGNDGYDALDLPDQQAENRRVRRNETVRRVWRHFRVSATWSGLYMTNQPLCPDDDGNAMAVWGPGLRMLDHLPLLEGHDYLGSAIASDTVESALPDGVEPRPLPPIGIIKTPDGTSNERYEFVDRLETSPDVASLVDARPREWSCRLDVYRQGLGVTLAVSGAPQHVIAGDQFTAADTADEEDFEAELDWQNLLATVAIELDAFAEARWPAAGVVSTADIIKEMTVAVPGARLDYVMPTTVVGLDDDGQPIRSNGGYVRDDRDRLRDVARLAYEWYNTDRRALRVTLGTLECDKTVGQLITTIGSGANVRTVNTVITAIDFDLRAGSHTVVTAFAELDAGGM